ncbi:MAG: hypothetical protein ACXW3L_07370, partial [Limisphaerales bacterium]
MKKLLVTLTAVLVSVSTFGQGTVFFNNRTSTGDAQVRRPDGTGAGAGVTAQLFLVSGSTFTALTPATTFRTTSAAAAFFVNSLDIVVPGIAAGSPASFIMRAYETAAGTWDAANAAGSSFLRGESNPVNVAQLGGITPSGGIVPTPDLA